MSRGKLLKPSEVADKLGVDSGTVGRYIREKRLPAIYTAGGHHRVYEVDVEEFLTKAERSRTSGAITIALINQKGGVGKTTAVANLAVLMHELGLRVLAVDLDPQGSLTWSMGYQPDSVPRTVYDTIKGEPDVLMSDVILPTEVGPDLAPNNILATQADRALFGKVTWGTRLAQLLREVKDKYDYILLDCAPNLNSLTVNALHAADYAVVPTQLEMLSVNGLRELLQRIEEAHKEANARLRVAGVVAMMVQHANSNREVEQILHEGLAEWGVRVFQTAIKRSTQYGSVANRQGVMSAMNPRSEHTQAYRMLLAELFRVVGGPGVESLPALESNSYVKSNTKIGAKGGAKSSDGDGDQSSVLSALPPLSSEAARASEVQSSRNNEQDKRVEAVSSVKARGGSR